VSVSTSVGAPHWDDGHHRPGVVINGCQRPGRPETPAEHPRPINAPDVIRIAGHDLSGCRRSALGFRGGRCALPEELSPPQWTGPVESVTVVVRMPEEPTSRRALSSWPACRPPCPGHRSPCRLRPPSSQFTLRVCLPPGERPRSRRVCPVRPRRPASPCQVRVRCSPPSSCYLPGPARTPVCPRALQISH
jgi:hypothetical protein